MLEPKEFIFIFLMGIVISCIIGFNTVSLIDKKFTNISVKLPETHQKLVIKVDKNDRNKINVYSSEDVIVEEDVENFANTQPEQKISGIAKCGERDFERIINPCKSYDKFYQQQFQYFPRDANGRNTNNIQASNYANFQHMADITTNPNEKRKAPQPRNTDL